jgi:hypothetical protein
MATRMSHGLRNDGMRVQCALRITQGMRIARRHAACGIRLAQCELRDPHRIRIA